MGTSPVGWQPAASRHVEVKGAGGSPVLLGGSANPDLTHAVSRELGITPGALQVERFPDGETSVRLLESVCRREVFIVQSTAPPVNEHLMELLLLADACRRDAAARITAIIPYFGYARADSRHGKLEPVSASTVAGLLQSVGLDHVITVDLHAAPIEGFFHIPIDILTAVPMMAGVIRPQIPADTLVVSPDAGRVTMATRYAELLGTSVIVMHKQRISGEATRVTRLIGEVRKRTCLIIDDMIVTGETIAQAIGALLDAGANEEIYIAATHGLFVKDVRRKLSHPALRSIFTTDTVASHAQTWTPVQVFSVAGLIAGAIRSIVSAGSLGTSVEQTA
jgi:ribose-phosphate pyrophosphokinase